MGVYLVPYIGAGTRKDMFRPRGVDGASYAVLDLRPDASKVDGYGLVSTDLLTDARATQIGSGDVAETLSLQLRGSVESALGISAPVDSVKRLIADLMFTERSDKLGPVIPWGRNGEREVWLNGQKWARQISGPLGTGELLDPTDNFTRGDETPLAAPWTGMRASTGNTLNLVSNAVKRSGTDGDAFWYYAGAAASTDQFAQWRHVDANTGDYGPATNVQGTDGSSINGYAYEQGFGLIFKILAGGFSTVATAAGSNPVLNDVQYLQKNSGQLTAKFNGVTVMGPTSDAGLTLGQPGVFWYQQAIGSIDDFQGGDLTPPSTDLPFQPWQQRAPLMAH